MVFNNTKVIQARMHFRKETGALIEVFLLEPADPTDYELMFQLTSRCSWLCLIGNLKKWKEGTLKRDFTNRGVDMRSISTDDIERVEIVRGIPSVEYGDLSNGVVKVNTLKGVKKVRTYMTWTVQGLHYLNSKLGYPNF